jgi:hypothetical protein
MALTQSHQLLLYDDPHSEYCAKACAANLLHIASYHELNPAQRVHVVALGAETARPFLEVSPGQCHCVTQTAYMTAGEGCPALQRPDMENLAR